MNKILNFHRVNDIIWFEKIVCFLKSKYTIVDADTVYQYCTGNIDINNSCHITVDDGDKTFYDIIFPVLKKHKLHASLFVSPKICDENLNYWFQEIEGYNTDTLKSIAAEVLDLQVDAIMKYQIASVLKLMPVAGIYEVIARYQKKTNTRPKPFRNMTVGALHEVDESGLITIGAHTMNHPILKNEDNAASQYETTESVNQLSALLKHDVKYFAYPNGIPGLDFTEREENYLKNQGVQLAFSTEARNLSGSDNKMSIPRIGVSDIENMVFLKAKLLAGSSWNRLKNLKPTGEFKERAELGRLVSATVLL